MEPTTAVLAVVCIALALLALVLAAACAMLCATVPFVLWRQSRLESRQDKQGADLAQLDETVDQSLGAAGLTTNLPSYEGQAAMPSNGWAPSRPAKGQGPLNMLE